MPRTPKPHWFAPRSCWRFQQNGRQFYAKTEALAWARLNSMLPADAARPVELVAEAIAEYLQDRPEREHALTRFMDLYGAKFLGEITTRLLADFVERLKLQKLTPWTIRAYMSAAFSVLRWAHDRGFLETLPGKPKMPTCRANPSPIDLELLGRILRAMDTPRRRPALQVIKFRIETGCRPGEACGLRWKWFAPDVGDHGLFRIPPDHHKTGRKTGRDRVIYLTAAARAVIDAQRSDPLPEFVFESALGEPFSVAGVRSVWRRAVHAVDPTLRLSSYRLRHLFGFLMRRQGVPVDVLQKLYGHNSISTTMVYYRAEDGAALEAVGKTTQFAPVSSSPAGA